MIELWPNCADSASSPTESKSITRGQTYVLAWAAPTHILTEVRTYVLNLSYARTYSYLRTWPSSYVSTYLSTYVHTCMRTQASTYNLKVGHNSTISAT